jgi:hypothetical protein
VTGRFDLVIRVGRALLGAAGQETACAIGVTAGSIAAIEHPDSDINAPAMLQLGDDEVLLPGLVDTHVHVCEPGNTGWEGQRRSRYDLTCDTLVRTAFSSLATVEGLAHVVLIPARRLDLIPWAVVDCCRNDAGERLVLGNHQVVDPADRGPAARVAQDHPVVASEVLHADWPLRLRDAGGR